MSTAEMLTLLAIAATLAAAILQPTISRWITPKRRLLLEITGSKFLLPAEISAEMYKYKIHSKLKLKPEFSEFFSSAQQYKSYFELLVRNTGSVVAENVKLTCQLHNKYAYIKAKNNYAIAKDHNEYELGSIQPREEVQILIWSTSYLSEFEGTMKGSFSLRDDHDSQKKIVLLKFYDRKNHIIIDKFFWHAVLFAILLLLISMLFFELAKYMQSKP